MAKIQCLELTGYVSLKMCGTKSLVLRSYVWLPWREKRKLMLLVEVIFWKILLLQQDHFLHKASPRLEFTIELYSQELSVSGT